MLQIDTSYGGAPYVYRPYLGYVSHFSASQPSSLKEIPRGEERRTEETAIADAKIKIQQEQTQPEHTVASEGFPNDVRFDLDLTDIVRHLATLVFSNVVKVGLEQDELYGYYLCLELEGDERTVLAQWLGLIDILVGYGINVPVFPVIHGTLNASPEEFGKMVGRALAKMGVFLKGKRVVNVAEILREEREA